MLFVLPKPSTPDLQDKNKCRVTCIEHFISLFNLHAQLTMYKFTVYKKLSPLRFLLPPCQKELYRISSKRLPKILSLGGHLRMWSLMRALTILSKIYPRILAYSNYLFHIFNTFLSSFL